MLEYFIQTSLMVILLTAYGFIPAIALSTKKDWFVLLLIPALGYLNIVVSYTILSMISLHINLVLIVLLTMLNLFGATYYFYKSKLHLNNVFFIDLNQVLILVFFIIHIVLKVKPIIHFYTPPLHDPISHSLWAKSIINTGIIDYFYSPGLHIFAAIIELIHPFNIPQTISLITNYFLGYLIVSIYLYAFNRLNKLFSAFAMSAIISASSYPNALFYEAGKNSFISALALTPIILFVIESFRSKYRCVVVGILLFGVALIHYPIAVISVFYYLVFSAKQIIKEANKNKVISEIILTFLIFGVLIVGFLIPRIGVQKELINNTGLVEIQTETFSPKAIFENTSLESKGLYREIMAFNKYSSIEMVTLAILLLVGAFYRRLESLSAIAIFAFALGIRVLNFNGLEIISLSIIIASSYLLLINLLVIFEKVTVSSRRALPFLILFIGIVAVYIDSGYYNKYIERSKELATVTHFDQEAFDWINKNLSNEVILNNAIQDQRRKDIIFPSDGGMWLGVYTDNAEAMSFIDFADQITHERYRYYSLILEDVNNEKALNYFRSNNINYLYVGSRGVYGPQINPAEINKSKNYELIFESGTAKLYKINN